MMKVNTNKLRAAIKFQAIGDVRYYLNGIRINKKHIEATNGHIAIRMNNCKGFKGDHIIKLIGSIPAKAVKTQFLIKECVAKHYDSLDELVGAQAFELIDGKYPDLDKVIPKDNVTGDFPAIQIKYISLFEKAFKKGGISYCAVKPISYDGNKVVIFKLNYDIDNEEFGNPVIAIMPTRD